MITTNFNNENATINVNDVNKTVSISDYSGLESLIKDYNENQTQDNLEAVLAAIDSINDVNKVEDVVNGEFKYYPNKREYYFKDDVKELYEVPEEVVATLECMKDDGVNIIPIVKMLKLFRRNDIYCEDSIIGLLNVISSSFVDGKVASYYIDKGFYHEVAYKQSKVNKFTLTDDGLIVAYKRIDFKKHKFDTQTGEKVFRYPCVYDEETGIPNFTYPESADDLKVFIDSKTMFKLQTLNEDNRYIKVGQIVDQREGKEGFPNDECSLLFKGTPVVNKESSYCKVLIHPSYIRSFNKFDAISTPVFYVTDIFLEGKKKSSNNEVKPALFIKYANDSWKSYVAEVKAEADKDIQDINDEIESLINLQ